MEPELDFEQSPAGAPLDETDMSLRSYLSQIPNDKLQLYQSDWTDGQVVEWDGNFRSDGCLMLVCCERDVDITEFRRVLREFLLWKAARPRR